MKRTCKKCNGTGRWVDRWTDEDCYACGGRGTFPEPDYQQIVKDLMVTRGKRRGRMKKAPPFGARDRKEPRKARAYYVWRLARFHGGQDVTMPMMAELEIGGDPYGDELDTFAGKVAEVEFGTQIAAAVRWGQALGWMNEAPEGLPDSAYQGGRVADEHKPLEELAEILDPAE